jgi:hypothetical protein
VEAEPVGWTDWIEGLRSMATTLFEDARASGAGREADLAMKIFGTMMGAYLSHLSSDPTHPAFLPSAGYYSMYGSPNPDTVYRSAVVDDTGRYLITGRRGTASNVTIMAFGGPTPKGLETFAPFDLAEVAGDDDGRFEVVLSRERPEDVRNWWKLQSGTRSLMLRSVCTDWDAEAPADPVLAIVRLDGDPRRERVGSAALQQRVSAFAYVVEAMIKSGINRVVQLRSEGIVNRVVSVDYSSGGGLQDQWYQEGCFQLEDDEALLIEAYVSEGCRGFSLSLTDAFFSTLDWANAQSSLNDRQAVVDADGVFRAVVASSDPGVKNWLDTIGHQLGVLQFRWSGGHEAPRIVVQKVSSASIGDQGLPTSMERVNADGRAAVIRERQIGAQLRSLW